MFMRQAGVYLNILSINNIYVLINHSPIGILTKILMAWCIQNINVKFVVIKRHDSGTSYEISIWKVH